MDGRNGWNNENNGGYGNNMNNADNGSGYGNNMNNGSYNYNQNNMGNGGYNYNQNNIYGNNTKQKKSRFGLGFFIGALSVFMITLVLAAGCFGFFVSNGYIHLGTNGEIYVQGLSTNDSEGIGSDVEYKLNALDSLLDYFYFEEVDDEEAATQIFKAYLAAYGDKYTVYYTPEEYKSLVESTEGKFYGIGAVCQKQEDGTILIAEAYENAPAYKAGLREGDCITEVDGKDITQMDLSSAVALIKGEKGTKVKLEVIRSGETIEFEIERDEVQIQTVAYEMQENNIGYLVISQFEDATTEQFKKAVADLELQGMKGLIIDIRDNPGGVLSGVVDILDEILPNGLIVYTEDKIGNQNKYTGSNNREINVPIAVLVNGGSASASEIFAGAVQDYGKGKIIGTQTFGKGIVQTVQPLTDGSAVKFTIAKYFTPKGQDIHGNGVTPDIVVEFPENAQSDVQYEAAMNYIKGELGIK